MESPCSECPRYTSRGYRERTVSFMKLMDICRRYNGTFEIRYDANYQETIISIRAYTLGGRYALVNRYPDHAMDIWKNLWVKETAIDEDVEKMIEKMEKELAERSATELYETD